MNITRWQSLHIESNWQFPLCDNWNEKHSVWRSESTLRQATNQPHLKSQNGVWYTKDSQVDDNCPTIKQNKKQAVCQVILKITEISLSKRFSQRFSSLCLRRIKSGKHATLVVWQWWQVKDGRFCGGVQPIPVGLRKGSISRARLSGLGQPESAAHRTFGRHRWMCSIGQLAARSRGADASWTRYVIFAIYFCIDFDCRLFI